MIGTAGGLATLVRPGLSGGKLSASARDLFLGTGEAILGSSLPLGAARPAVLAAFVDRVEALIGNLHSHSQGELSQLLSILCMAPGRLAIVGLKADWPQAAIEDVQAALQDMRTSSSSVRRQAYQALHDIAGAAYFADASAWPLLGYPGPREIA